MKPLTIAILATASFFYACSYVIRANGEEWERISSSFHSPVTRGALPPNGNAPPLSPQPIADEVEPQIVTSNVSPRSWYSPEWTPQTRGDVIRWDGEGGQAAYITFYCKACNTPRHSTQTASGIPLKQGIVNFAVHRSRFYSKTDALRRGQIIEVRFHDRIYRGAVTDVHGVKFNTIDIHVGDNWTRQCRCSKVGHGVWRAITEDEVDAH